MARRAEATARRNGFSLYRWFRDIPIARKLYFTVGTMAVLIGVELFVLLFSLNTLSSLRAYVGGEGLWSKAQKDAVFHLYRYGVSRTDDDYRLFQHFMQVPMGDAKARQGLLNDNTAMARAGFLQGRNHQADIEGMISLFTDFSNNSYIRKAIGVWGEAQPVIMQLLPIAEQLHDEIGSSDPSQARIDQLLAAIYSINQQLTAYEDEFSYTLGEASRWLERVVFRILLATALTVETTGLLLAVSVSRGIHKGLTDVIEAANSFANGQLDARARVVSRDEIGVVAKAFNEMAQNLQTRMGELADLNRHLSREVDERKRAEAEVRTALARLETTLQELQRETAERLRAEELLRQSEKLRALGQLTGGIAHDFNNLLSVIIGGVEILSDTVQDDPERAELAREILNSALNGSVLTRRLLAVGRNQPLSPQRVDLKALVTGEVALLRRTLGEAILIETVQAPDLWLTSADPSQIGDALLNLALNARDAMPRGGRLTIAAGNVHLDAKSAAAFSEVAEGDYVVLTVTDTGIGMPQSVAQRAIEPFFTTKPPSLGSGLGLSMAYGFAKQSGGHLEIESAVGEGTSVRLYLPRANGFSAGTVDASPVAAGGAKGREVILLVDDNQALLEMTRRQLTALGYQVIATESGPSALAVIESDKSVDLLLTDMVMPGSMSGPELADAARRIRPELGVLFTTGYATGVLKPPGHRVLYKPYDRRELARAVREALDRLTVNT